MPAPAKKYTAEECVVLDSLRDIASQGVFDEHEFSYSFHASALPSMQSGITWAKRVLEAQGAEHSCLELRTIAASVAAIGEEGFQDVNALGNAFFHEVIDFKTPAAGGSFPENGTAGPSAPPPAPLRRHNPFL